MPKRIVYVRNVSIVPAETIWPGRCQPGDIVMHATLVSAHPVLGAPTSDDERIRTSLIVNMDLAARRIETLNTMYEVVI